MNRPLRGARRLAPIVLSAVFATAAPLSAAQTPDSIESFRNSYQALMDSYDRVFQQEGDAHGQEMVAKAKAAMQSVKDADLVRVFSRTGAPDVGPALAAMQRLAALSRQSMQSKGQLKSLPLPSSPTVIDACNNTPHGDQITYDALIAYQVTSGILAAAAWVCNEDILGENGSAACIPLAIANDIASSLFAVRNFCAGLDTAATVNGNYSRLGHIHDDLTEARNAVIANTNTVATTLTNNINASTTSIINNDNTNKDAILASIAANTTTIVDNQNANRDKVIGELRALGCEIIRLLNTPEGRRASSILACSAQSGFPYSWNMH
ncbi:MAG: hypothetical protein ACM3JC_01175 [Rudaea sp.]